jgi:hypothetical protein
MAKMKAMEFTDKLSLQPVIRPVPEPRAGEILIQVSAVGVTRTEKLWSTTSCGSRIEYRSTRRECLFHRRTGWRTTSFTGQAFRFRGIERFCQS